MSEKIRNYEIKKEIGKGGMGRLYLAVHPELKRRVILKELSRGGKEFSDRFKREAEIMMHLRHDSIANFYDFFTEKGKKYIVMEYIEGKSLADVLEGKGSLDPRVALMIFMETARGLAYAHAKKVLHRDLKPQNIMISSSGIVKIIDFGIASMEPDASSKTSELTSTGLVMGTPAYMSPEQLEDMRSVTERSDIYSLGIILFEMVTGQKPFEGGLDTDALSSRLKEKYYYPGVDQVPSLVRSVIDRCLRAKPSKRFSSASEAASRAAKPFRSISQERTRDCVKAYVFEDKMPAFMNNIPVLYSSFLKSFSESPGRSFSLKAAFLIVFVALPALWVWQTPLRYKFFQKGSTGAMEIRFTLPLPAMKRLPDPKRYPGLYRERSERIREKLYSFIDTYYRDLFLDFQLRASLSRKQSPSGKRVDTEEVLLTPQNYVRTQDEDFTVELGSGRNIDRKLILSSGKLFRKAGYYILRIRLHGNSYVSHFRLANLKEKPDIQVIEKEFRATPRQPVQFIFMCTDASTGEILNDARVEMLFRGRKGAQWKELKDVMASEKERKEILNGRRYSFRITCPGYKQLSTLGLYASRQDQSVITAVSLEREGE